MRKLKTLSSDEGDESIQTALETDGACILEGILSHSQIERVMTQVMPYINRTALGSDDFTGRQTRRTGSLVARSEGRGRGHLSG